MGGSFSVKTQHLLGGGVSCMITRSQEDPGGAPGGQSWGAVALEPGRSPAFQRMGARTSRGRRCEARWEAVRTVLLWVHTFL